MGAIYNEIDPFAARWLRNLIAAGHVAPGAVDERGIAELAPADIAGPGQRHFFAGIAGWSRALRLAGVPDDADVWTGSCPCQSLSDAGKRLGFADERHLWPAWFRLIRECRPAVVFGEQVASSLGLEWLDLVFADLEGAGYACAAADLCAAGAGAPHQRQRLFFVAYADGEPGRLLAAQRQPGRADAQACGGGEARVLADAARQRRHGLPRDDGTRREQPEPAGGGPTSGVADTRQVKRRSLPPSRSGREDSPERIEGAVHDQPRGVDQLADSASARLEVVGEQQTRRQLETAERGRAAQRVANASSGGRRQRDNGGQTGSNGRPGSAHSGWDDCDWIPCSDGVSRPVEPGTHPLAHGVPGRVGLLRGYGNAIVPQVAATFIRAALGATRDQAELALGAT